MQGVCVCAVFRVSVIASLNPQAVCLFFLFVFSLLICTTTQDAFNPFRLVNIVQYLVSHIGARVAVPGYLLRCWLQF